MATLYQLKCVHKSDRRRPKGCRHFVWLIVFDFNSHYLSLPEAIQSVVSAQISATMADIRRFAADNSAPLRRISPSSAFPSSLTQLTSVRSTRMAAPLPACSQQLRSSFTQAPANLPSSLKVVTPAPLLFVIFSIAFHYSCFSLPLLR